MGAEGSEGGVGGGGGVGGRKLVGAVREGGSVSFYNLNLTCYLCSI